MKIDWKTMRRQEAVPPDQPEAPPSESDAPPASPIKRMLKKFGVAGFIFFFLKGLIVWILIPLGLFRWFGGCG